jgi:hypothetical protein
VVEWSGLRAAGKTASDLNKNTIIINNTSPIYMPQQEMSNYMSPYGGNPNFNANYAPNPNNGVAFNVNPGQYQMNAKINY